MASGQFSARRSAGSCYFCGPIFAGDMVYYMTAYSRSGSPERPLSSEELREYKRHVRDRMAGRGRYGRRSTGPVPVAPDWLWERLVHVDCASREGYAIPGRTTDARPGTRDVGMSHGASIGQVEPAEPASATATSPTLDERYAEYRRQRVAPEPADIVRDDYTIGASRPAPTCGRIGWYASTRGLPCILPTGHLGSCAYERVSAPENDADSVMATVASGSAPVAPVAPQVTAVPAPIVAPVERARIPNLDDDAPCSPDGEGDVGDASIARFRMLMLD